jgi:thymidine kinase
MRTAIVGPMWAGKTYILKEKIDMYSSIGKAVAIIEPVYNTRNSDRDLQVMVSKEPKSNLKCYKWGNFDYKMPIDNYGKGTIDWPDIAVIDEVHLFEVYEGTKAFITAFKELCENVRLIYVSGIWCDCYNDYRIFPVWGELTPLLDSIQVARSLKPCHFCKKNAWFTRSTGKDKVGDAYVNVCHDCRDKILPKGWED